MNSANDQKGGIILGEGSGESNESGFVVESTPEKQKLDLNIQVKEVSVCQRHVTVTIPRQEIDRYFAKQFDDLIPKALVPGFRPGKAPRRLVESKFRPQVADQVKGALLLDSMTQINDDELFSAISEPDFDFEAIKIPDSGDLTYEFDIEVRPEFELPNWKGITLERPVREISDKDVLDHLQEVVQSRGNLIPKTEGAVEKGDFVTVDVRVKLDGKEINAVDGESIRVADIVSFPDAVLENFDDVIVGANIGDSRSASATISTEAENEDLRGKKVDIEFKVAGINSVSAIEISEELVRGYGYSDKDAFKAAVKNVLERQHSYHQSQSIRRQISNLLTESANWELPPELLKRQSRREVERRILELRASGFEESIIRQHENDLRQNSLASTKTALREHFILERIAEENNIQDAAEDYEMEINLIALQQNDSPRRVRARLERRGQMDALRNQIIERKVLELIKSSATIKDVPYKPAKDDVEAVEFALTGDKKGSDIPEARYEGEDTKIPGTDK